MFCIFGVLEVVRKAQPFTEKDLWNIMNRLEEWNKPLEKSFGHHGDCETYRDRVIISWAVRSGLRRDDLLKWNFEDMNYGDIRNPWNSWIELKCDNRKMSSMFFLEFWFCCHGFLIFFFAVMDFLFFFCYHGFLFFFWF